MSLFTSETVIKAPFFDIDPMGVVWHGNYIKYMEIARCDMFSKLNYTYMDMKDDNYMYPIAKMETKFIEPVQFDQEITAVTVLEEIEPAIKIKYLFKDKKTNKKLFKATTLQIAVDIKTRTSLYEAPEKLKKILKEKNEK